MTRLYLIRHGETEWNRENRTQGCSKDQPLSEKGLAQAKAVAERFRNNPIDVIYSSDLIRAYCTAKEISNIIGSPIKRTEILREMNFGCWEGLTSREIEENYKDILEVWRANPADAMIPGGETVAGLQSRVTGFITDIIQSHEGKNIIIVSHGIALKILIISLLGMDVSYHSRLRLDNTSVSIIDYHNRGPVLTLLNDTCHLA